MRFSTSPFLPTAYYLLGGHVLLLDYLPRTYCYLLLLGGHVLLVASSAAAAPGVPGVAAYAASKAYVRRRAGYPPSLVPTAYRSIPLQQLPIL